MNFKKTYIITNPCSWEQREILFTEGILNRKDFLRKLKEKKEKEAKLAFQQNPDNYDLGEKMDELQDSIHKDSRSLKDYKKMYDEAKEIFRHAIKKWLIKNGDEPTEENINFILQDIINNPGRKDNKEIEEFINKEEPYDDPSDWSDEALDKYESTPDSRDYNTIDLSHLHKALNDYMEDFIKYTNKLDKPAKPKSYF